MKAGNFIIIVLILLASIGWLKCVYKATKCNWEPVGKAEVVYSIGVASGFGAIIGWMDIKDK
jgi:hypothetical protein